MGGREGMGCDGHGECMENFPSFLFAYIVPASTSSQCLQTLEGLQTVQGWQLATALPVGGGELVALQLVRQAELHLG